MSTEPLSEYVRRNGCDEMPARDLADHIADLERRLERTEDHGESLRSIAMSLSKIALQALKS
jgi:hypothetical protein